MGPAFWLRWSWRDLRRRLPQVVAIAAIIALGSGVYAGLGTTSEWRRLSLEASVAQLSAHDIRVDVVAGSAPPQTLAGAVATVGTGEIALVETQYIARLPVTVGDGFAAGEVVGVDLDRVARMDGWAVTEGRGLTSADRDVVVLDTRFANAHDLPATGVINVAGRQLRYVGHALSPAYLSLATTSGDMIRGASTRAVMLAPIQLAHELGGVSDMVNTALVRVGPGHQPSTVAAALEQALATSLPVTPVTVTALTDDPSYRAVHDEIETEQHLFDIFALMILAGAVFAVFNLVKRTVDRQRREIGIAMSLGVPPSRIALRPLLLAFEITLLGVMLGAAASQAIAWWVLSVLRAQSPLPIWATPFEVSWMLRGVVIGLGVPTAAALYPVWRALRVRPIEALQPAHLSSSRHLLSRLVRRLRLPGTVLAAIPLGRVLRAPTRTLLTVAAIAFVMAPLFAAFGAADSTTGTLDTAEHGAGAPSTGAVSVDLTEFQPAGSATVTALSKDALVANSSLGLNVGGYVSNGGAELAMSIAMVKLDDPSSTSIPAPDNPPRNGLIISAKAADDLNAKVGDTVRLRHPHREGVGFTFVESSVPIAAIHASPYRFVAYMGIADADLMGLTGIFNTVKLLPAPGVSAADLQRHLVATPGVASALTAQDTNASMRDTLAIVSRLFIVLQIVIAALAFLVAFNTSNLGADEREREHATMLAFGVPVHRLVGIAAAESLLLGAAGVAIGLGLGAAVLRWLLDSVFPAAVPDLAVTEWIAPASFAITLGIGLAAAATAPLLNARRLRTMNLPTTLRYVE